MKTANKRWQQAQKFEYHEWVFDRDSVPNEFDEARRKYQKVLGGIERKYNFQNDWAILDLGCGPTLVGRLFTRGKLVGIDPLVDKLEMQELYPDVAVVTGKGEELPFEDESFDVVFCRNVIDHSQSPKKVISEARRVLRKGGFFLLACYTYTPLVAMVKNLTEKTGVGRNIGHPFTFTPQSLERLVLGRFSMEEELVVHKGLHPNDYGKVGEQIGEWSLLYKLILFLNFKVFRYTWFVKEILLVCRKT